MPTTRGRYKIFEAKPIVGGVLITRGSSDNAGVFNYTEKSDWRRDLDIEMRREGCDYFQANLDISAALQAFPGQIKLDSVTYAAGVATATRSLGQWFENGEQIVITGVSSIPAGTYTIANVTSTSFQFSVSGTPVSPDAGTTLLAQPVEEINLIALARRPNGQTAVIAGSKRRIYRYFGLEDPNYISIDPADYPIGTPANELIYWSESPADYPVGTPVDQLEYISTNIGNWIVIGSGFSPDGKRWETVSINGYMVFNNSVDLLVTYRVEELSVVPIYELREQGIASVGTISTINGVLICGDISEIRADTLADWFNDGGQLAVTSLTRVGSVATATIAAGHSFVVGQLVVIKGASFGEYNGTFPILSVTATTLTYSVPGTPTSPDPSGTIFAKPSPYYRYTDQDNIDRTIFRVLWGTPDEPRRWAPIVPGSINVGSNVVHLDYPVLGFQVGQNITIVGAGASHAGGTSDNLQANVLFVFDDRIIIDGFAETTVTDTSIESTDAIGSIVGYEDLQDDGSGIIKMLAISSTLVIYKDTSIVLCQYIGSVAQPFAFTFLRVQKESCPFYRNTVVLVETASEMFHLYAGRNCFWRFDLTNQQPVIVPHFEACSNLFYDQATLANTERIWAADNGITHEIMFVFPSTTLEKALILDYKQDTISTTTLVVTAAATVRKPLAGLSAGAEEDWVLMGTSQGAVLIYGRTTIPQTNWGNSNAIYYRRFAQPYSATKVGYTSTLKSGLGHFGNEYGEKDIRGLLEQLGSQSPSNPVTVNLYSAVNPNAAITLIGFKLLSDPANHNLLPLGFRGYFFQSSVVITGTDNPYRHAGLLWDVAPVDSRSVGRV